MQNRKWFGYDVLTIIIGSCKTVETHYFLSQSVSEHICMYDCYDCTNRPECNNAGREKCVFMHNRGWGVLCEI